METEGILMHKGIAFGAGSSGGSIPSNLVDLIYPVGSIYMSVNNTDPSVLFGGTWESIEDRFLLASGENYTAGDTGGSDTQTPTGVVGDTSLTEAQLPAHKHLNDHYHYYAAPNGTGGTSITTATMPSHGHNLRGEFGAPQDGSYPPGGQAWQITSNTAYSYVGTGSPVSSTGSGSAHSHTVATKNALTSAYQRDSAGNYNGVQRYTSNAGSGTAHGHSLEMDEVSTMPPYLSVYMWKRTE